MVEEADNLILRMLREIRSKLDEHDKRFAEIDQRLVMIVEHMDARFDEVDERFDDMRMVVSHGLGLATATDVRSRHQEARVKSQESWRVKVDDTLAKIDQRFRTLEGEPR